MCVPIAFNGNIKTILIKILSGGRYIYGALDGVYINKILFCFSFVENTRVLLSDVFARKFSVILPLFVPIRVRVNQAINLVWP